MLMIRIPSILPPPPNAYAPSHTHTFTHTHSSRKWREEQAEMLAQKDAEEAAALEDLRAQARKELSEWYSRSDDQLNQTKISNRWGRGGAPSTLGLCFHILVNFWTLLVENW